MSSQSNDSGSWWGFYAVRYAMGTVVGGAIFYFLASKIEALRPMLFLTADGKIEMPQIVLLAAYGMTYCYIASAPILVFHASRFLIRLEFFSGWVDFFISLFNFIIPFSILFLFGYGGGWSSFYWSVMLITSLVLWFQVVGVFFCIKNSSAMYKFYKVLAKKRIKAEELGLADSYRHLREHGNSFLIVVLEIFLAVVLFTISGVAENNSDASMSSGEFFQILFGFLFLWMFPAACVWLIGTIFERRLQEDTTI
ncbi:hypothetical protein [Janthinobacterium sp. SUN033]|uniref:hypothetical protein n=1 Tax=Janthinobacterium sp. SUN033 TaxID=3002439 RepID=UPI0025B2327F|nr:hypothetical protein [Janthinobacterium sp. SUN033]MDN2675838.1 hypothetical protein [Janthinobacterium sp. SUN033]